MTALTDEVKTDLTKGLDWLEGFTARIKGAAPGILAAAEKYETSPIVQALEGALLPPAVEQSIASTINELKKAFPAPAPSDAVPSFTPAGPQVAGQA